MSEVTEEEGLKRLEESPLKKFVENLDKEQKDKLAQLTQEK